MKRARVYFEVSHSQHTQIRSILTHGLLTKVYRKLTLDIIALCKDMSPHLVVGGILSGKIGIGYNNMEIMKDGPKRPDK